MAVQFTMDAPPGTIAAAARCTAPDDREEGGSIAMSAPIDAVSVPIDPTAVDRALAPFGENRTFPAAAYISSDVLAWERRHFFEGSWTCVGRVGELSTPGAQRAVTVGDESVLVVREESGGLRGYSNVCRHRGHQLLKPGACADARVIKCPYHAWVYGLDGSLRGAPSFSGLDGFDKADFPLQPVGVAEWHGWLFVNASGEAG